MSDLINGEVFQTERGAAVHVFIEHATAHVFDLEGVATREEVVAVLPAGWTITAANWEICGKLAMPYAKRYCLTRDIKLVVVTIDTLNDNDAWFEAAYASANLNPIGRSMPMTMAELFRSCATVDCVDAVVAPTEIDYIRVWAESLPGWEAADAPSNAPHPLIFSAEVAIEDAIETLWGSAIWSAAAKALSTGYMTPEQPPEAT
jgi:hypothetical protein